VSSSRSATRPRCRAIAPMPGLNEAFRALFVALRD
jgi:hypothetical protein